MKNILLSVIATLFALSSPVMARDIKPLSVDWKEFKMNDINSANAKKYMSWIIGVPERDQNGEIKYQKKVFPSGEIINQAWLDKAAKFQPVANYVSQFLEERANKLGVLAPEGIAFYYGEQFIHPWLLFDSVGDDAMPKSEYNNAVNFCGNISVAVAKGSFGFVPRYFAFGCYASYVKTLPTPKTFADIEACAIKNAWDVDIKTSSDLTIDDRISRVKAAMEPCVSKLAIRHIEVERRHYKAIGSNNDEIYVTIDWNY